MSNIREYPTSSVSSGRVSLRNNMIKLYLGAVHIFSKQHYSQLLVYGRQNLVSGTPSTHIHTDAYLYIHQRKKVILASIYPTDMLTVSAIYCIIQTVNFPPSFFPCFLKQPKASPLCTARSLLSHPSNGDS